MATRKRPTRGRGRPRIDEITEAQHRTFEAIRDYIDAHGESPTISELCEVLEITTAPVHDSVTQLVRKGYLERERYSRRGLKVVREPAPRRSQSMVTIPLLGNVVAGTPTQVDEHVLGEALVPADMVDGDDCFALKVQGESMKGAGLADGDTVIVRPQPLARHGEVVVALVDGEATIKRLFWSEQSVELRPENRKFRPIRITPETDFRIVGKVIAQSSQWS